MKNKNTHTKLPFSKLLFLLLFFIFLPSALQAQRWNPTGTGSNALNGCGEVLSMCSDPAGNIYAVGEFTTGANPSDGYPYVAKWNGTAWSMLGTGVNALDTFCGLSAICSDAAGNIYVAGIIDNNGFWQVAKWNGVTWSQLGFLNANSWFNTICTDGSGNVYVAGDFTDGGGYNYVAKWNGSSWTELGSGSSGSTTSLCADRFGNIYAVGNFTDLSGNYFVAEWNGSVWSSLGGFSGLLYSVCVDPAGHIYVAGDFPYYLAEWNGSAWNLIGSYFNAYDFTVHADASGNIYAGGDFFDASLNEYVAKWDGSYWSEPGGASSALDANGRILAITTDPAGNVYAAGQFTYSGRYYVAKFTYPSGIQSAPKEAANSARIYPNPSSGQFTVELAKPFSSAVITLTDELGRCVTTKEWGGNDGQKITIAVNTAPGTYLLRVAADAFSTTQMIQIQ